MENFRWYDFALLKLAVAPFTLMAAKLCLPLLSLEWAVYLIIAIVAAAPLYYKIFKSVQRMLEQAFSTTRK